MAAWIFQANPAIFDSKAYFRSGSITGGAEDTWMISGSGQGMESGDRVYFWRSGGDGLTAVGHLTGKPEAKAVQAKDMDDWTAEGVRRVAGRPRYWAPYRVERVFRKLIATTAICRADPVLSRQRPIAPVHVGSSFAVSEEAARRFEELIAEA